MIPTIEQIADKFDPMDCDGVVYDELDFDGGQLVIHYEYEIDTNGNGITSEETTAWARLTVYKIEYLEAGQYMPHYYDREEMDRLEKMYKQ